MLRGGGGGGNPAYRNFFVLFSPSFRDTVANAKSVNTIHLAPSIAAMACEPGGLSGVCDCE